MNNLKHWTIIVLIDAAMAAMFCLLSALFYLKQFRGMEGNMIRWIIRKVADFIIWLGWAALPHRRNP